MSPAPRQPLRRPLAGVLLSAVLLPAVTQACAPSVGYVDVYDRTEDRALDVHRHRGRQYIVGTPGHEYAVRIRNCSDRRVLAVVSVDGVNVVTGESAAPDQSGYVIEPHGYVTIEGWRKDLERTAAFYFSDPGDAYATRTGRPDDLGVIGVALFRERAPAWTPPAEAVSAAPPAAARQESAADAKSSSRVYESSVGTAAPLGTGHGRREWSPAQRVEFERASSRPDQRVVLRYDRHENLVAKGVLPAPAHRREPDPFPAALGFVPDP
jgi:hypothetical protein